MFLSEYHLFGIVTGLCTFLIIGLFHPLVIKAHYYFGTGSRWWFAAAGVAGIIASFLVDDIFLSTLLGVAGFSSFWSVKEILEQEQRVAKGWFPANPKRQQKRPEMVEQDKND